MVRIGIVIPASQGWMGGINYIKNLLNAVSAASDKKVEFILFFGKKSDEDMILPFKGLGKIVKTSILDKSNFQGFLNLLLWRIFGGSFLMRKEFKKNNVDIVSHSRVFLKNSGYRIINWIPDFQHLHMPEMFSFLENIYRKYLFRAYAKNSDAVILSSHDALADYKDLFPEYVGKAHVLQFVSQTNEKIYGIAGAEQIKKKYGFSGKFFYLPNQLWKHKNHPVVLKALNLLKKEGKEMLVICTGQMEDYRNKKYVKNILKYAEKNGLQDNIKFLGLIDYIDVLTLMRHCVSIINPSLFEGWSSTVEEAKSVGKNMLLSNLNVHREQNPPDSIYFDPYDEKDLSEKMWQKWQGSQGGPDFGLEENARKNIKARIKEFGKKYQDIVVKVFER